MTQKAFSVIDRKKELSIKLSLNCHTWLSTQVRWKLAKTILGYTSTVGQMIQYDLFSNIIKIHNEINCKKTRVIKVSN